MWDHRLKECLTSIMKRNEMLHEVPDKPIPGKSRHEKAGLI